MIKLPELNSTTYLQNTCHVELPINKTTRLNKGFRFIISPKDVSNEILKHEIKFHQTEIVLEESTSTRKKRSEQQSVNIRPRVAVNKFSENQDLIGSNRKSTVLETESYAKSVNKSNSISDNLNKI